MLSERVVSVSERVVSVLGCALGLQCVMLLQDFHILSFAGLCQPEQVGCLLCIHLKGFVAMFAPKLTHRHQHLGQGQGLTKTNFRT